VKVNILNLPDNPLSFAPTNITLSKNENISTTTPFYTTSVNNPDLTSLTYSISGVDASYIDIAPFYNDIPQVLETFDVFFKISPDYETKASYNFSLNATDAYGNTGTQTVKVNILNLFEPLSFAPTNITLQRNENISTITPFYTTSVNNPELISLTYSISGVDASYIDIAPIYNDIPRVLENFQLFFKFKPDYETKASYDFSLNATTGPAGLNQIRGFPFGYSGAVSAKVDPTGQFLYVMNLTSNKIL
jgi:hypothetical protein